jgi:hypothetical protein
MTGAYFQAGSSSLPSKFTAVEIRFAATKGGSANAAVAIAQAMAASSKQRQELLPEFLFGTGLMETRGSEGQTCDYAPASLSLSLVIRH